MKDQMQPQYTNQYHSDVTLTAPDAAANDWFGSSVAIAGDTAVVAADGDTENGNDSGSVYVFNRSAGVWSLAQKITPGDGGAEDYFGYPLAISGDTFVVAASRSDASAVDAGAVYVYRLSGGVWGLEQKLVASDAGQDDWFGTDVEIDGDTIVVSAPKDDDAANNAGAVYVFTRTAGVWNEVQKVTAADASADLEFGTSVAIDAGTFVVGAERDTHAGTLTGSAYVFQHDGSTWQQSQKLIASEAAAFENFGRSVAIDAGTILVGSDTYDGVAVNSGAVYAFVQDAGVWTQQQRITQLDGTSSDRLGFSLSLVGDTALVGSVGGGGASNVYGAAFVFQRFGDTWIQQSKFVADGDGAHDQFSHAVAHDGTTALIGAYLDDDPLNASGSVYFYDAAASTATAGSIDAGSGNLAIESASIDLLGQISGSGTLSIQASRPDATIELGGGTGPFVLDDFELSQIADGFSSIQIGDPVSKSQTVALNSTHFDDPVMLYGQVVNTEGMAIDAPSVSLSGVIAPGQSPGILAVSGDLTIADDSTLQIELAGSAGAGDASGHDQVAAGGTVDVGTNVVLETIGLNPLAAVQSLTIVERNGGGGTFVGLPEGQVLNDPFGNGQDFQISYAGGDGDDIVLDARTTATDIALTSTAINENVDTSAADLLFSSLSTVDPDPDDSHAYELIEGSGDTDNSRFKIIGDQLYLRQGESLDYETQSSYTVRVRTTDTSGLTFEKTLTLDVNNLVELNKSNVTINDGSNQRSRIDSVTVQFDTDVVLQEGAITIHKRGVDGGVAGTVITPLIGVASSTFTLEFTGAFTEFGSLSDGNYELRIDGAKIVSAAGFGLDANQDGVAGDDFVFGDVESDNFFRNFGDINGDRFLSTPDFIAFRNSLGSSTFGEGTSYDSDFDYNLDGFISTPDFIEFRNRLGGYFPWL